MLSMTIPNSRCVATDLHTKVHYCSMTKELSVTNCKMHEITKSSDNLIIKQRKEFCSTMSMNR